MGKPDWSWDVSTHRPDSALPRVWADFNACGLSGEPDDHCYYALDQGDLERANASPGTSVFIWDESDVDEIIGYVAVLERLHSPDGWRARPTDGSFYRGPRFWLHDEVEGLGGALAERCRGRWAMEDPGGPSLVLPEACRVEGLVDRHLGPRWAFARIEVEAEPADSFDVEFAPEVSEAGPSSHAMLVATTRGLIDELITAKPHPLRDVRLRLVGIDVDPVDSSEAAFRQAGRDAGRRLRDRACGPGRPK